MKERTPFVFDAIVRRFYLPFSFLGRKQKWPFGSVSV